MSLDVRVHRGPYGTGFDQTIVAAAEATLQDQGIETGSITIVLTDEPGICEYNLKYAGIDQPTDVLSFPDGELDPDSGTPHLGDVIVCPPIAMTGAAMGRHQLLNELCLLTVHGVLHLLDYDHEDEEKRNEMWAIQDRILERLGGPIHGTTER